MTGKLKLQYFLDGTLRQEEHSGILQEAAQVLAAEAITKHPNVQITWTVENGA